MSLPANPMAIFDKKKTYRLALKQAQSPLENDEMKELELIAKRAGVSVDIDALIS